MWAMARLIFALTYWCAALTIALNSTAAGAERRLVVIAASSSPSPAQQTTSEISPEEKMARRFPQPIKVGDLVGLPVLDWSDRTIGYVQQVVQTPEGKIQLIVPYRAWFGWLSVAWGTRPVAVPIETVAMLGRQVAALEMPREAFDAAPTFSAAQATPIGPNETIRIAITKR